VKHIMIYFFMPLLLLSACSQKQKEGWEKRVEKLKGGKETVASDTSAISLTEESRRFVNLQVSEVHRQRIVDAIETPAVLKPHPNAQLIVKAPVQGWIKELPVQPGSTVKRNDLLAVIENPNNLGQRLTIKAPIGGTITARQASPNAWIESGEPLLQIIDFRRLQAVTQIYPEEQPRVKIGQRLEISRNGQTVFGTIFYLSPTADPQTGAIEARADIANPNQQLKANVPVTARITVGEKDGLIAPKSALMHEEDHFIVFVQKGGQFEKRLVETGIRTGEVVEILEGIKDGEQIVTSGAYQLKNMTFSSAPAAEDEEEK